jgi:hypothetical protein
MIRSKESTPSLRPIGPTARREDVVSQYQIKELLINLVPFYSCGIKKEFTVAIVVIKKVELLRYFS